MDIFFTEKKRLAEFTSFGLNSYVLVLRDCYFSYCVPLTVFSFVSNMVNECDRCKRPRWSFDYHVTCSQCRLAAALCQLDASHPAKSVRVGLLEPGKTQEFPL